MATAINNNGDMWQRMGMGPQQQYREMAQQAQVMPAAEGWTGGNTSGGLRRAGDARGMMGPMSLQQRNMGPAMMRPQRPMGDSWGSISRPPKPVVGTGSNPPGFDYPAGYRTKGWGGF